MRRLLIGWATQDASVSVLGAKFRLSLVADEVAGGVEPTGALLPLDDELIFEHVKDDGDFNLLKSSQRNESLSCPIAHIRRPAPQSKF
jgi:hypothetical protein